VPDPSLDLIRGVPLFAEADESFLQRLAGEFMERTFAAGATIAEEGEAGRTFIVIERGEVTVTVHGEEVARLGPGDSFGEMALIDKSARSATVKAEVTIRYSTGKEQHDDGGYWANLFIQSAAIAYCPWQPVADSNV